MSEKKLIKEITAYYRERAPWHDEYMGYVSNIEMEKLLRPVISDVERHISNKSVLEIACGTGNWTQVLARRAKSVLAIDINDSVLQIARTKKYSNNNVIFKIDDAFSLEEIDGKFDVAFAADWWSHIPRSMIPVFISKLHGRLDSGCKVIIIDMYPRKADLVDCFNDDDGNLIGRRKLPDGRRFEVIKNSYSEIDMQNIFKDIAGNIEYHRYDDLQRWMFIHTLYK